MPGLSPKLPLERDFIDGYSLNKSYRQMIIQNLKMVLLTIPGERVMDPDFGVGLKTYLFEPQMTQTHANLNANIRRQVAKYLPFVKISDIKFETSENSEMIAVLGGFKSTSSRIGVPMLMLESDGSS